MSASQILNGRARGLYARFRVSVSTTRAAWLRMSHRGAAWADRARAERMRAVVSRWGMCWRPCWLSAGEVTPSWDARTIRGREGPAKRSLALTPCSYLPSPARAEPYWGWSAASSLYSGHSDETCGYATRHGTPLFPASVTHVVTHLSKKGLSASRK